MDAFDATLKRAFAEADEPVDNGFAAAVSVAVARREKTVLARQTLQRVLLCAAAVAVAFALAMLTQAMAPQLLASLGLELARAHGALAQAPGFDLTALGGMTQLLFALGALAAGAAVYRSSQA